MAREPVQPDPGGSSTVNADSKKDTASSMPSEVHEPHKQKVIHSLTTTENGADICEDYTCEKVISDTDNSDTHLNYRSANDEHSDTSGTEIQCSSGR
jgi:hypothetical protein